jgi:hypothetical protein
MKEPCTEALALLREERARLAELSLRRQWDRPIRSVFIPFRYWQAGMFEAIRTVEDKY